MTARRRQGQLRERFHQAAWQEPLVIHTGQPGRRGMLLPDAGPEIRAAAGDVLSPVPNSLRRAEPPGLPELSQPEVVRHYTRLSQMVLANNVSTSLGLGTTTMKYNPVVNELLSRSPKLTELHPDQDESTMQGILELLYRFSAILAEVSGMERFTFQPAGGSQGILANALMMRAYHASRGEAEQRDEVITTIFSHPANAAAPATIGYKVITLYPGPDGIPELDALRAAAGPRTAGLMMTNPEDTGIFNPRVAEYVEVVHAAGGLCAYDQANANSILGVTRARDAGFDMCQFNLHKTFGVPHGCMGGAVGATGVQPALVPFLPSPTVEFDGTRYYLDADRPLSVGAVRSGLGNIGSTLKAYAWVCAMGAEGLRDAAHMAVLNNNYLLQKVLAIPGASLSFAATNPTRRLEQARYSWEQMAAETGIHTTSVHDRMIDYGVQGYFSSHHPWLVPEPFTLEPTESTSQEELDEFAAVLGRVVDEAHQNPGIFASAPHNSTAGAPVRQGFKPAMTWQAFEAIRDTAGT
ncbi:MAG: glycine dehydrogenase [Chloroflexi bacterium RBG_16_72_14]|nr:MAG: glycine dehydrogenase [Chloroflexi bacterium RBG_16_72_14]